MRILYVDGKEIFARTNLLIASMENPQAADNIVHVTTFEAAVFELERATGEKPFDLIISALVYEGRANEAGIKGDRGGVDLYRFCIEENIEIPLCFLTLPEKNRVEDALEKAGLALREDTRFFQKGTPLIRIVEEYRQPKRDSRPLKDQQNPDVRPR